MQKSYAFALHYLIFATRALVDASYRGAYYSGLAIEARELTVAGFSLEE